MKQILLILFTLLPVGIQAQYNHLPQTKDVGPMKVIDTSIKVHRTVDVGESDLHDIQSYPIGKLWKEDNAPYLDIMRDNADNYSMTLSFFSFDGFYTTDQPTIILIDDSGGEIELGHSPILGTVYTANEIGGIGGIQDFRGHPNTDYLSVIHKTNYLRNTQIQFVTSMFFLIPDINAFANHKYVKLSFRGGELEYDLRDGGTKIVNKFNKNLQKAVKHVTKLPSKIRYEEGWHAADSRFSFVPGTSTYSP